MKIMHRLTRRHLRENKKRTVITIIGIIISVAMITATCVSLTSLVHIFAQDERMRQGNWHSEIYNPTAQQIESLQKNSDLKNVSVFANAEQFNLQNKERPAKGIGNVLAANRDYFETHIVVPVTGRMPVNANEIAVSRKLMTDNGITAEIGDTLTLPVGTRYYTDETGLESVLLGGDYMPNETFRATGEKSYTLVGILEEENPATRDFAVLRGLSDADMQAYGCMVHLTATELNFKTESVLNSAVQAVGIHAEDCRLHRDLFRYNWVVLEADATMATLLGFAAVILVIIIIASVLLIFNAFGISISERSRYLGMLASVGATRAQKRGTVYYEGFLLGLIGIPLGIGFGLLGIGVTFRLLRPALEGSGLTLLPGVSMGLSFPWWILPLIVLLSAMTIAISAYIPARRASRVSPIDALRQTGDVKVRAKRLRVPCIVRRLFGYEGELAYKNIKRNGKKSRVITVSLVLSVTLFLSVYTFCDLFDTALDIETKIPYQVYVCVSPQEEQKFRSEMEQSDLVKDIYCVSTYTYYTNLDAATLKQSYKKQLTDKETFLYVLLVEDEDFNRLCTANKMDSARFYDTQTPRLLLMNDLERKADTAAVLESDIVGKTLACDTYFGDEQENRTYTVGGLIPYNADQYPCAITPPGALTGFLPKSTGQALLKDNLVALGLVTDAHAALTEEIYALFDSGLFTETKTVMDYAENTQMMRSTIFIMQVFLYGFISLMTLISVANIFNTVSTSIDLRRKEFAMLRSVGVTPKGFRRMLRFESLFYGLKALVYGLPLSLLLSYLMYYILTNSYTIPFYINPTVYILVILGVFLIVGLSMAYSTAKVKKDSIIDTLKTEIQ